MAEQLKRYDAGTGTWIPVVSVTRIEVQGGGPTTPCDYFYTDGESLDIMYIEDIVVMYADIILL